MSHWIWGMDLFEINGFIETADKIIICSKCRASFPRNFENDNLCPNCGTEMRKEKT